MRICFITTNIITRHAAMKRALGLAPRLIEAGHEVTICIEDAADNRAALNEIPRCRAIFYKPQESWWSERSEKRRQLRSLEFDFVHICGLGWRNALLPGIELRASVIMEHEELESSFVNTSLFRRSAQWLLEFASLLLYLNIVASSRYLEQLFRSRTDRLGISRNILYLPFANERAITRVGMKRSVELRRELGPFKIIMYTGTLYTEYGVLDLLDALIALRSRRTDWICVYSGNGPAKDELEKRIEAAGLTGRVRLLGRVSEEELAAWMATAAVFASPLQDTVRDWARCPSKTFMYMMFEKPVVTCRVGENLHCLGDDGFYYLPNDQNSMCLAIDRALDASVNWRPSYRVEDHTWQSRAADYERWLLKIAASKSEPRKAALATRNNRDPV